MTGVRHLKKAEHKLKTYDDYTYCKENYGRRFLGHSEHHIHQLSDGTTDR